MVNNKLYDSFKRERIETIKASIDHYTRSINESKRSILEHEALLLIEHNLLEGLSEE